MWARNTLTQRAIGPESITTVELDVKNLKDGDVCGLGNINVPCSWAGIVKDGKTLTLRWFEQLDNDTIDTPVVLPDNRIWLRFVGDFDNDKGHYAYSLDGKEFHQLGREMTLSYQLITFQGARLSLFAFNKLGKNGGYAEFDNFTGGTQGRPHRLHPVWQDLPHNKRGHRSSDARHTPRTHV